MSPRVVRLIALIVLCGALWIGLTPQAGAQTPGLLINEVLVGNASTNLDPSFTNYAAWIELRNTSSRTIELDGYRLESLPDGATTADVFVLDGSLEVPRNGYLLLWADEHNTASHAPFELDMDGGTLRLVAPGNSVVDSVSLSEQAPDVSYGRAPDAGATWAYYDRPTPGAANNTLATPAAAGGALPAQAAAPVISPAAGFYAAAQRVTISAAPGATIRYTTNGARPTESSTLYSAPFSVAATAVVRARAWLPGQLSSPTATASLFIGFSTSLPVVSIATHPDHLFDSRIGIYIAGVNGIIGRCSETRANWNQPWERPVSMELFEGDGQRGFQQDTGIEIHGNCSRNAPQKSLEIKTRKTYGDNDLDYRVFPDNPLDEYRRLILRGRGTHNASSGIVTEPLAQLLGAETMNSDHQQYRPVILFINGQYWGIYGLRDKADEALIEQNYGLDKDDEFDMIENKRRLVVGDFAAVDALYDALGQSMTDPANYAAVLAQIDEDNFMDYFIAEFYVGNRDWPGTNVRIWRPRTADGQWRWLLYDLDASFNLRDVNRKTFPQALQSGHYGIQPLQRLLVNPTFKAAFLQRFASHLAITYAPQRVRGLIDAFSAPVAAEVPRHVARWQTPQSVEAWRKAVEDLRRFADLRPAAVRSAINKYLGSPGTAELTLNVAGGQGQVQAAGVAPFGYPFSALYFRKLPLTLRAVPAPGYRFVRWQETGQTTPEISLTLAAATARTAVFEAKPLPQLVLNELHYNPADAQGADDLYEFVEIVNAGAAAVDLSGFSLRDGVEFTFPNGASLDPGAMLLVAKTAATYAALPGVPVFQWTSGDLSNGGETLTLADENGNPVDSLTYDDAAPWPTLPDGSGPSLSLLAPGLDNADAANWAASAATGGTPGAANFP